VGVIAVHPQDGVADGVDFLVNGTYVDLVWHILGFTVQDSRFSVPACLVSGVSPAAGQNGQPNRKRNSSMTDVEFRNRFFL